LPSITTPPPTPVPSVSITIRPGAAAAPAAILASAAAFAVVLERTGRPTVSSAGPEGPRSEADVHGPVDPPRLRRSAKAAEPHRSDRSSSNFLRRGADLLDQSTWRSSSVGRSRRCSTCRRVDDARQDFVPPTSTLGTRFSVTFGGRYANADAWRGYHGRRMSAPRGEKRIASIAAARQGQGPAIPRPTRERGGDGDAGRTTAVTGRSSRKPACVAGAGKRWTALSVLVLLLVFILWTVAATSRSAAAEDANKRLPNRRGSRWFPTRNDPLAPTDILLLGTDHSLNASRASDHTRLGPDPRTDPKHHKLIYLSIARSPGPGHPRSWPDTINAALPDRGARWQADRSGNTGLPITTWRGQLPQLSAQLIDKLGGIDINVPSRSSRTGSTAPTDQRALRTLEGLALPEGHAAHERLSRPDLLARPREPTQSADTDITRGARQQAVVQALMPKLSGAGTFFKLPFIGGDLMKRSRPIYRRRSWRRSAG